MSPATTRRSARLHATNPRPRTATNNVGGPHNTASSSDDDDGNDYDNEFIPANISPHRVVASANGPSLRPPRPSKRHPEDGTFDHNASAKRLRTNGSVPSLPARSPKTSNPERHRASRSASMASASDNYVDPELFNFVNSKMLKRKPDEAPPVTEPTTAARRSWTGRP
ncbi:hypothetical protein PG994_005670 [Apiospora phragmitis]|uniref:Uncharacterized protein n=1 Tax=Apiospora phragmitis TaxID=2905665 RepID=A0ABR1VCW5_9PEZI